MKIITHAALFVLAGGIFISAQSTFIDSTVPGEKLYKRYKSVGGYTRYDYILSRRSTIMHHDDEIVPDSVYYPIRYSEYDNQYFLGYHRLTLAATVVPPLRITMYIYWYPEQKNRTYQWSVFTLSAAWKLNDITTLTLTPSYTPEYQTTWNSSTAYSLSTKLAFAFSPKTTLDLTYSRSTQIYTLESDWRSINSDYYIAIGSYRYDRDTVNLTFVSSELLGGRVRPNVALAAYRYQQEKPYGSSDLDNRQLVSTLEHTAYAKWNPDLTFRLAWYPISQFSMSGSYIFKPTVRAWDTTAIAYKNHRYALAATYYATRQFIFSVSYSGSRLIYTKDNPYYSYIWSYGFEEERAGDRIDRISKERDLVDEYINFSITYR